MAGLLPGCGTEPPVRLHTLQAPADEDTATAVAAAALAQPLWIALAPVRIPAAVDRPEWVIDQPDGSLRLLDQDRWAGPLRNEVQAALLERLRLRHGAVEPQRPLAAGSAPVWRVVVDIERLESAPGVQARLDAAWSISSTGDRPAGTPPAGLSCHSVLRQPAGVDTASLATAHRRNVQALADAVGAALSAAASGGVPRCTAAAPS